MEIAIGSIRHNLKLLEKISKTHFRCLCLLCNQEHSIRREKFGRDKSCGCLKLAKGKANSHFKGYEEIHKSKWNSYIRNAKQRNISFSISIEYAWNLFLTQEKKCALTNLPISFWTNATERQATASLDRIDNSKGYVEGNVQWVHKKINQIKMDMSVEEFIKLCLQVTDRCKPNQSTSYQS